MSLSETKKKESETAYRHIVESAHEMITIIQNGRFRYANPATTTLLGYLPEELYQMSFPEIVTPDDREVATQLCAAQADDQTASSYEIGVIRKDGQLVPVEMIRALITYEGQPAVQLVARDISEQKRLHEQLAQSEKAAALGRFMSAVAHELNNPLTVIAGFAEILLSDLNLNEQEQADLQMIASEANRARRMIQDLLRLSRAQPPQKQLVDLNQLIATTLDRHQADLQARRSRVITELASDLPLVSADPDQLEEVFTTLLNHFRKSLTADPESGRLRVKTTVKKILARTGWRRGVEIIFVEEGPGRSPDQVRQMFEPSYSTREEDRGLGLALAYNLIQQHDGRMYAFSGPGEGVSFIIELPLMGSDQ